MQIEISLTSSLGKILSLLRVAKHLRSSQLAYRVLVGVLAVTRLRRFVQFAISEVGLWDLANPQGPVRLPRVFVPTVAGEMDLDHIRTLYAGRSADQFTLRMRRGMLCFLLRSQGLPVAAEWVALGPGEFAEDAPDLGCIFGFPESSCWLFDGIGRSPGAWGALMRAVVADLHQRGIRYLFNQMKYSDIAALNSHFSMGFRIIGRICFVRFFSWSRIFVRQQSGVWNRVPVDLEKLRITEVPR
jgi:hypothetical protein